MRFISPTFRVRLITVSLLAAMVVSAPSAEPVDPGVGDAYPLALCVITETELDDEIKVLTHEQREIRVCCKDCVKQFYDSPNQWLDKVSELIVQQQTPYYPSKKCVVTGKALGKEPVDFVFRNRLFRLCSKDCQYKIEKKPAKYFGELDLAVAEKQKTTYPLTKCVVSGKPLGKDVFEHVVANQLVRLAGLDQFEQFNTNPAKYLLKIQTAAKKKRQRK